MRTAISVLGIDIGKNVCSLVGLDANGKVVLRRRAKRETLIALAAKLPPRIAAMEACCGAHHLGRIFAARGHEVRGFWRGPRRYRRHGAQDPLFRFPLAALGRQLRGGLWRETSPKHDAQPDGEDQKSDGGHYRSLWRPRISRNPSA